MSTDDGRALVGLLRAVARLSLTGREQLDFLGRIGVSDLADELALDLQDAAGLVQTFRERGWLTAQEGELIARMDELLVAMSGPDEPSLWRRDGLLTDPRWEAVRAVAREFLYLQGIDESRRHA